MWKAVVNWSDEAVLLGEVPHDNHPMLPLDQTRAYPLKAA